MTLTEAMACLRGDVDPESQKRPWEAWQDPEPHGWCVGHHYTGAGGSPLTHYICGGMSEEVATALVVILNATHQHATPASPPLPAKPKRAGNAWATIGKARYKSSGMND